MAASFEALVSTKESEYISCAWAELQNHRPSMEDRNQVFLPFIEEKSALFCVFDGHGGVESAKYLVNHLADTLMDFLSSGLYPTVESLFVAVFKSTNDQLLRRHKSPLTLDAKILDGSTATVALFQGFKLHVANVGDSPAILCRDRKALRLTKDHNCKDPEEVKRVKRMGGQIYNGRISGQLAITRAFGDSHFRPQVSVEPHVVSMELGPTDRFLIVASDGILETYKNDQSIVDDVLRVLDRGGSLETACQLIIEKCSYSPDKIGGSRDNTTVQIVSCPSFK